MEKPQFSREMINEILEEHPKKPSSLIPILQSSQDQFGYLPRKVIKEIGNYLDMTETQVYGVATFYSQFRFEPLGDHVIRACHGTACHVKGSEGVTEAIENEIGIETGETTDDGKFTLQRVACLGCCSLAPVIMIDDEVYGNLTREKTKKILKKIKDGEKENE